MSGWPASSSIGSKAGILRCDSHVRFTPESGHVQCHSACLLCANSGHEQRLVALTWVVSWIDVIDAARASELNLEDQLLASSPSVVGMLSRVHPQRAWL